MTALEIKICMFHFKGRNRSSCIIMKSRDGKSFLSVSEASVFCSSSRFYELHRKTCTHLQHGNHAFAPVTKIHYTKITKKPKCEIHVSCLTSVQRNGQKVVFTRSVSGRHTQQLLFYVGALSLFTLLLKFYFQTIEVHFMNIQGGSHPGGSHQSVPNLKICSK